jgi:hypothetical protein
MARFKIQFSKSGLAAFGFFYVPIAVLTLAIFFVQYPVFFARFFTVVPMSFIHPGEGDFWPVFQPDPLQLTYLVWQAAAQFSSWATPLTDPYQFANLRELFTPLVTDPLVYLGGMLHLLLPLGGSYNAAFFVVPQLAITFAVFFWLRALGVVIVIAAGFSVLAAMMPYRIYLIFQGQHIGASVFLIPLFLMCLTEFIQNESRRKASAKIGLLLVLFGFSEEHLAYGAVLFCWPWLIVYGLCWWRDSNRTPVQDRKLTRQLYRDFGPALVGLFLLVLWGMLQNHLRVENQLSPRKFDYDFIKTHSEGSYSDLFIMGTRGFGYITWGGIFAVFAMFWTRCRAATIGRREYVLGGLILVFLSSSVLAAGYFPELNKILGIDVFEIAFDYLPLFDKQRYPSRQGFFAYFAGLALSACGWQYVLTELPWLGNRKVWRFGATAVLCIGLGWEIWRWTTINGEGQYFDLSVNPLSQVHEQMSASTKPGTDIILRLPVKRGSGFEDSRTQLDIIYTGQHFFNGYFSQLPKVYQRIQPIIADTLKTGEWNEALPRALDEVGVTRILIDREFIDISSGEFRRFIAHPRIKILFEHPKALYAEWSSAR